MRGFYFILLILSVAIGTTYWYQSTASTCPAPLSYKIGDIDTSFNLSPEEALSFAVQAETYWENAAERELFKYDEKSKFTIDFIFDERQESANSEALQRNFLDKKWDESEEVRMTVEGLQADYKSLSDSYENEVGSYEARLESYNIKVNKYNDRGGAPSDIYKELEVERLELSQESEGLNQKAKDLNNLASDINRLSERGNRLVNKYNQEVEKYNSEFGFAREFTQGDYHEDSIRIYKFSSDEEVVTVLAHEFGHALGINHVEGDSSLMYYLLGNTEDMPTLSEEDIAALIEVCGEVETLGQKIRRIIRDLLNIV